MKYDQEIEREIQLEEQDFVDLFRDQETVDDGTRVHMKKLDFLRALGRLDPMSQLTDEEREELRENHGTPNTPTITTEVMETDHAPEERRQEFEQLLRNLSISGEYTLESIEEQHGDWAVEALNDHEKVEYSDEYKSFAWVGDEVYDR